MNALPLPALDGGYLALLALEAVRKKKLDQVRPVPLYVLPAAMGIKHWYMVLEFTMLTHCAHMQRPRPEPGPVRSLSCARLLRTGTQVVEQGIMASGLLLLMGAGLLLVVRDLSHLAG